MAKTFRFSDALPGITFGTSANSLLTGVSVGTGTRQILAPQASGTAVRGNVSGAANPGASGVTGDFSVVLNVSVAASGTTAAVRLSRINATGTIQTSSAYSAEISTATTGDKTFATFTAQSLGTWGATDRLAIEIRVTNTNVHGGDAGPTFNYAAANTRIDSPFPPGALLDFVRLEIDYTEGASGETADAVTATGTGTANQPRTAIAPSAGLATGTGTALQASVTTGGAAETADAITAEGIGAANNASVYISTNALLATGTGAALQATVSTTGAATSANAGVARGSGLAHSIYASIPTYIGSGTVSEATADAGVLSPTKHASTQFGDLLILRAVIRTDITLATFITPEGWTLAYGPDAGVNVIGSWTLWRFSDGSALDEPSFAIPSGFVLLKMARIYTFRNAHFAGPVEGGAHTTATSTTVSAASVTTTGVNRLAVAFPLIADDLAQADFSGETGGDWVEAEAEYTTATGADASMGIQTAPMSSAGTISGGTFTITSFRWSVRSFAIVGMAGGVKVSANAVPASGTGSALNASALIKPNAGFATGTGTALAATATSKPVAVVATGTGVALNVIPLIKPNAGLASGTGAAHAPPISIAPRAEVATGTGTAYDATFSLPAAETADAVTATGTGSASDASALIKPNAAVATGTGAALNATGVPNELAPAVTATATGTANNATVHVKPNAGLSSGTGLANNASSLVKPNAAIASGIGTAFDATASVEAEETADAEVATGTGTALNATVRISANAGANAGTGLAAAVSARVEPRAAAATGTGVAGNVTASTTDTAPADTATGSGTALDASVHIAVGALIAVGSGTAYNVTAQVEGPPQSLRPIADLAGNWHGEDARTTNLYTSLDDEPFEDATYIESPDNPTSSDFVEFDLPTAADPLSSEDHVVRYRYGGDGSATLIVELRQGTTVIASWEHIDPSSPALAEQTLTEAEADAITDYSDLRIRVRAA